MSSSSQLKATVVVPTHDHGALLNHAVQSALAQTVRDLEVFIVGDGVDDDTRAVALGLVQRDSRVRFFDWPKGERHGEALRHAALQEARGEIICYLSDDDLWLPAHVEALSEALADADFAHVLPVVVDDSQHYRCYAGHLAVHSVRDRMLSTVFNYIPLSAGAHTRAFYQRLPRGWNPAPREVMTDLHMWRQILAVEDCRPVSLMRATMLNFPAPLRKDWSLQRRADELAAWSVRLGRSDFEREVSTGALDVIMRSHVERDRQAAAFEGEFYASRSALAACQEAAQTSHSEYQSALANVEQQIGRLQAHCGMLEADRTVLNEQCNALAEERRVLDERCTAAEDARLADEGKLQALEERCLALEQNYRALEQELGVRQMEIERVTRERDLAGAAAAERQRLIGAMERTITWRARNRLLTMPAVAALVRRRSKVGSAR